MFIETSRFGTIQINQEDLLTFDEGLLGFVNLRKFVLLEDPSDEIFVWLQSCELPEVAFPVLEPELFSPSYEVRLTKSDLEALCVVENGSIRSFSIVTIPQDPQQMTANLKAPIVVNTRTRKARQCVLQDNSLAIREPIFSLLQQRLVQSPGQSIREHQEPSNKVSIRLPQSPGAEA